MADHPHQRDRGQCITGSADVESGRCLVDDGAGDVAIDLVETPRHADDLVDRVAFGCARNQYHFGLQAAYDLGVESGGEWIDRLGVHPLDHEDVRGIGCAHAQADDVVEELCLLPGG